MKAHENVLVFYGRQPTYNPIKTIGHIRKVATKKRDDTPTYGSQNFEELFYDSTERYPRSVLVFPSDKQTCRLHPTQKPVALMEYFIRTYTHEGDTVLDNAMGSGTTGVACANLGRRFIGIEKERGYFEAACNRVDPQPECLLEGQAA
jgi:DNA modification methylase